MKMPTQMMSSACQNRPKQSARRMMFGANPFAQNLRHHRAEPQQADRDMQTVASDQGEERRQERAAIWAGVLAQHARELIHLKDQESRGRAGL